MRPRESGRRWRRGVAAALMALAAAAVLGERPAAAPSAPEKAETLRLGLPIRCRPGDNCWLVNLVDLDPGPGRRDYLCGQRTYDGHKGTDIAIRDLAAMARGVAVLASAAGRVKALRDGMADVDFTEPGAQPIAGKECGNGVVVDHGAGWETQYCHLRKDSVAVRRGQTVTRGQKLGLVGNSGRAQFPHVHLSVRRRGNIVDPFAGEGREAACGVGANHLWLDRPLGALRRPTTALYNTGFATAAVEPKAARRGTLGMRRLSRGAPALVLWVDIFWVEAGDELTLRLLGPDGAAIVDHTTPLDEDKARYFAFAGKKRKTHRWPAGTYRGEISLVRDKGTPEARTFSVSRRLEVR